MIYWVIVSGYLVLLAAMAVLDLIARRDHNKLAPLGDMLERFMVSRTTRVGIIAAWWWFGWHFLFAPPVG